MIRQWFLQLFGPEPTPLSWLKIIDDRLPFALRMPPEERARWRDHLWFFANERIWKGIGIDVTDEMKVIISGTAAHLSINIGLHIYSSLKLIVIHPTSFQKPGKAVDGNPIPEQSRPVDGLVAGGRFSGGHTMVLAWDAVEKGVRIENDGDNIAIHELAHVIDFEDGKADGFPDFFWPSEIRAWARMLNKHFDKHQRRQFEEVLDPYGATDRAEFFAVATEAFFEKPTQIKVRMPELYDALQVFFKYDPPGEYLGRMIIPCPECGKKNRIKEYNVSLRPICPICKSLLFKETISRN